MKRIIIGSKNGNWTPTAGDVREILDAHVDDGATSPSIERINEALTKAAPSNVQFHNGGWQGNTEWIDEPFIRVSARHRTGGDLYAPIGLTWALEVDDAALLVETKIGVVGYRVRTNVDVVDLEVVLRHSRGMSYDDALMKAAQGHLPFDIESEEVDDAATREFNSRDGEAAKLEIDWATAEVEEEA